MRFPFLVEFSLNVNWVILVVLIVHLEVRICGFQTVLCGIQTLDFILKRCAQADGLVDDEEHSTNGYQCPGCDGYDT
jgi:hypothetical protein